MTSGTKTPTAWAVDETRRFFRAFHKHGTEFDKVSRLVGSGRGAEQCEALHRQHQAYLSLDKKFQSEVAFIAMVQDATQHLLKMEDKSSAHANGDADSPRQGSGGSEDDGPGVRAVAADSGADVAARDAVGKPAPTMSEGASVADGAAAVAAGPPRTLASTRARRTPRPSSAAAAAAAARTPQRETARVAIGARTPASSAKRPRAPRSGDGIYEFYEADDVGPGTESARKRRSGPGLGHQQKRLDFEGVALGGGGGGARHDTADEMGGIDALLTLALVGAESQAGDDDGGGGLSFGRAGADAFRDGEVEEEEEEEADAGAIEADADSTDEDYLSAGERRRVARARAGSSVPAARRASTSNSGGAGGRRTPGSTPQRPRSRGGLVAAATMGPDGVGAATPQRRFSTPGAMLASPGLLSAPGAGSGTASPSPGWMVAAEADLLGGGGDLSNLPDLGYLTSPGLAPGFAGGGVPSPARPMPRIRRRKFAPERSPSLVSPIKALYARRHSLGAGGAGPVAALLNPASVVMGAAAQTAGGPGAAVVPGVAGPSGLSLVNADVSAAAAAGVSSGCGSGGNNGASGLGVSAPPAMTPAEAGLRHALTFRARRWCVHEFLYSALDREWCEDGGADAARALLAAAGLPTDVALTRGEWAAVRAGFGRPRRLSLSFLHEQRAELEAWRERARDADAAASGGGAAPESLRNLVSGGGVASPVSGSHPGSHPAACLLPAGLPRPLFVGQRVVARHPATRQLHDGAVLTVGRGAARVQFDRRELGVEMVRDTDIAPTDPAENLSPEPGVETWNDGAPHRKSDVDKNNPDHVGSPDGKGVSVSAQRRRVLNGRLVVDGKSVNGGNAANPLLLGGGPGAMGAPGTAASIPGLGMLGPSAGVGSAETATQGLPSALSQAGSGLYGVQGTPSAMPAPGMGPAGLYPGGAEAVLCTPAGTAAAVAATAAAMYAAASANGGSAPPRSQPATAGLLADLTVTMHKKEALVAAMRAMNDEAHAGVYANMPGGMQNPAVVEAYKTLVLNLCVVDDAIRDRLAELQGLQHHAGGPRSGDAAETADPGALLASALVAAKSVVDRCRERMLAERGEEIAGLASTVATNPDKLDPDVDAATAASKSSRPPLRLPEPDSELDLLVRRCVAVLLLLQRGGKPGTPATPLASIAAALTAAEAGLCGDLEPGRGRREPPVVGGDAAASLTSSVQSALAGLRSQLLEASA